MRSVAVKKPLVTMIQSSFPGFRFVSESGGCYGFVREKPGYWYDYLPIQRYFDGGKGDLSIDWHLIGTGCVPDWNEWSGYYHTPWRVRRASRHVQTIPGGPAVLRDCQIETDPEEPPSPLASPGPNRSIRYQTGGQSFLPQALEVLADKLRRYALPTFDCPFTAIETRKLRRWHALAEYMLPRIADLELLSPETLEELRVWQKQAARRGTIDENVPPAMVCWREEIRRLPGFAEQWDTSPLLREWTFNWFTHALTGHP